jgi:hypothetical protein
MGDVTELCEKEIGILEATIVESHASGFYDHIDGFTIDDFEFPIAFLNSHWLLQFEGTCIPRRQELPKEAFYRHGDTFHRLVCISYTWETAEHPDPAGRVLRLVKSALGRLHSYQKFAGPAGVGGYTSLASIVQEYETSGSSEVDVPFGVFWDFGSLYQKPRRNDFENESFQHSLKYIQFLFMHPSCTVLRVSKSSSSTNLATGAGGDVQHDRLTYFDRGWPFAEMVWSSLFKKSYGRFLGCVYDISDYDTNASASFIKDGAGNEISFTEAIDVLAERFLKMARSPDRNFDSMIEIHQLRMGLLDASLPPSVQVRQPPLTPEEFETAIKTKSFMNGKNDSDILIKQYRHHFTKLLASERGLYCNDLGWSIEHVQKLSELVGAGFYSRVDVVDLSNIQLGGGTSDVSCLVRFMTANGSSLSQLQLSCTGLTHANAVQIAQNLPLNYQCRLTCIDLDGNPLGDEGINVLWPLLVQVWHVSLRRVGLSDDGVSDMTRALESSSMEEPPDGTTVCRMGKLYLDENLIRSTAALDQLYEKCETLMALSAKDNPLDTTPEYLNERRNPMPAYIATLLQQRLQDSARPEC